MKLNRTDKAVQDIEACLYWSVENFGVSVAHRYRVLLEGALLAILLEPGRVGSKVVQRIRDGSPANVSYNRDTARLVG